MNLNFCKDDKSCINKQRKFFTLCMLELKLIIDGENFNDIDSFYEEINRLVMEEEDWKLGSSLDAFNDLLYGGIGNLKNYDQLDIIWKNSDKSRLELGLEPTINFYRNKLSHPEIFNVEFAQKKLNELESGNGLTYFEILLEIISEHKNIRLILR